MPACDATAAVEELLDHFGDVGFSGAPRSLGPDKLGHHVLEHVLGKMAHCLPPLTASEPRRHGAFIQELHECRRELQATVRPQWNVVTAPLARTWSAAMTSLRGIWSVMGTAGCSSMGMVQARARGLWDLAHAASTVIAFSAGGDLKLDGPRLRASVDGCGPDERERNALAALISAHTRGMSDLFRAASLTGEECWRHPAGP
jgi:hypothetical protein